MNIRIMSYLSSVRHAELVSASLAAVNQSVGKKTLKQVQGDVLIMIDDGYSNK